MLEKKRGRLPRRINKANGTAPDRVEGNSERAGDGGRGRVVNEGEKSNDLFRAFLGASSLASGEETRPGPKGRTPSAD